MNKKMLGHFLFVCLLLFPFLSCTDHMQERVAIALNFSKDNKQEFGESIVILQGTTIQAQSCPILNSQYALPLHLCWMGN